MRTKLERIPSGLSELVDKEAKRRGVPKTFVYRDIESAMQTASDITKLFKRRNDKPLFRF